MKPIDRVILLLSVTAIALAIALFTLPQAKEPTGLAAIGATGLEKDTSNEQGPENGIKAEGEEDIEIAEEQQETGIPETKEENSLKPSTQITGGGFGGGSGSTEPASQNQTTPEIAPTTFDELDAPAGDNRIPVPNLPISGGNVQYAKMPF